MHKAKSKISNGFRIRSVLQYKRTNLIEGIVPRSNCLPCFVTGAFAFAFWFVGKLEIEAAVAATAVCTACAIISCRPAICVGVWLLPKLRARERERRRDRLCLRERLRLGLREEWRREECRCERRDRRLRDEFERRLFREERERSLGGEHDGDFRIDGMIAQLEYVLEVLEALSDFVCGCQLRQNL